MAVLRVHAAPKAGADEIVGWRGGELLVRVTAPPENGKANAAVCKLLANALGVPKSAVRVTRGDISRHKTVEAEGMEQTAAERALGLTS